MEPENMIEEQAAAEDLENCTSEKIGDNRSTSIPASEHSSGLHSQVVASINCIPPPLDGFVQKRPVKRWTK